MPWHFESPVEKDEIMYRMGHVSTADKFTDEEHKLFLTCLIPVERAGRRRKFNHVGWLLSNKTHCHAKPLLYVEKWSPVVFFTQRMRGD